MIEVRLLTPQDWEIWKSLRLEALREQPQAYNGAYEDEILYEDEVYISRLQKTHVWGAFKGGRLVGCIGLSYHTGKKLAHKGYVYTVYVQSGCRGEGIAAQLLKTVITFAKKRLVQLNLRCTDSLEGQKALNLYKRYGFQVIGQEPYSLHVNGKFYSEFLMALVLVPSVSKSPE